jgi:hypothetical protein
VRYGRRHGESRPRLRGVGLDRRAGYG